MAEPDFSRYHIYCDESCTTQHRYIIIGAIFCGEKSAPKIEQSVENVIRPHGGTSELKWAKVRPHNLPMYKDVVDLFFRLNRDNVAHYFSLVIDSSKMDIKTYSEGDKEIGFNKMLFTLLFKFARAYRSRSLFHAYLDHRTTVHTPEILRTMLNARSRRDLRLGYDAFRTCQFRHSHELRCIQLADLLTGAIGYATNRHDLKLGAAKHKTDLVNHISTAAGLASLAMPTRYSPNAPFDIWHIDFEKSRKVVPRA